MGRNAIATSVLLLVLVTKHGLRRLRCLRLFHSLHLCRWRRRRRRVRRRNCRGRRRRCRRRRRRGPRLRRRRRGGWGRLRRRPHHHFIAVFIIVAIFPPLSQIPLKTLTEADRV